MCQGRRRRLSPSRCCPNSNFQLGLQSPESRGSCTQNKLKISLETNDRTARIRMLSFLPGENCLLELDLGWVAHLLSLWALLRSPRKRNGAPNQDRSRDPDQGVNRTAPSRAPSRGGSGQALLLFFKDLTAQVGRFSESRNLTLTRRSNCLQLRIVVLQTSPIIA